MNVKKQKLGLLIATILGAQTAYALPQGAQVVQGSATINSPNSSTLNITNSNNAIINWQQFNIGAGQTTNFIQPNSASSVLNRVINNNPSQILGNLNSNGQVYLINQHGILVGEGARINTNGFFASTLNITNQDFLNGNLKFSEGGLGDINNKGYIHAGEDGNVVLIAPNIENGGVIEVENGNIILAAGESITISSLDNSSVEFQVQASDNSVTNLGSVIAKNGAASLFAGTLKHSGSIRATGLVRGADGKIRLVALDKVEVSGTVDVSGEKAGNIEILGDVVDIQQGANINASGSISAGEILIGGDQQGLNPSIKNATSTTVAAGAQVSADGLGEADGGRVIVFASNDVHIQGDISATGGDIAGDGGFIETSGLKQLDITAIPDASAVNGEAGEWLIDPNNITIQSTGGVDTNITTTVGAGSLYDSNNDGAILSTETIVAALDQGTNVTITTGTAGADTELGNITVNDAINFSLPSGVVSLTLNAHNDININADIGNLDTFGADLNLTLTANTDNANGGSVNFNNAVININGGTLTLSGDSIEVNGATNINDSSFVFPLVELNAPLTITPSGTLVFGAGNISDITVQGSPIINNGILTTNGGCGEGCGTVNFLSSVTNNGIIRFDVGNALFNGDLINNAVLDMLFFDPQNFDANILVIGSSATSIFTLNTGSVINDVSGATWEIASFGILDVPLGQNNVVIPTAMTLDLNGGTINNFEKLTLPNTLNIDGGTINFNSDITLANSVTTNIENTVAPLTLTGPVLGAYFSFEGITNFEASDVNFDIDLVNTDVVNAGDWNFNGFAGQSTVGAGINGSNSSFSLLNDSRLIFNDDLSHIISVPVLAEGAIELANISSNASFTGLGGLTLKNGGRLSGIGTYTGDVNVDQGGQISPGLYGNSRDNTGTLSVSGNVFFNSGSIGIWEIDDDGVNFDQLNVTGNVEINNAELFLFWDTLATSIPSISAPIDLIQAFGTITQTNATLNDLPSVAGSVLSVTVGSGESLTYTPGTAGTINYWTGLSSASSPDWNDSGNWSLGIPLDGQVLVIETGIDVELSVATANLGDVQLDANLNINAGGSLNGTGVLSNLQDIRFLSSTSDVAGTGEWNNFLAVFADDDINLSRAIFNNYGGFNWSTPGSTTADFIFTGDDFNNVGTVNFQPLSNGNGIDFSSSLNGLTNAGLTVFNIGDIETRFTGTLNNTTLGILSVVSPNSGATLKIETDNTNSGEIFLKDTALSLNNGVTFTLASTSSLSGVGSYIIGTGSTLQVDNVTFGTGLTVDLSGGILGTLTNIVINDAFNWTSGTLEGSTTGTLTTGSSATTLLGSSSNTTMNNVSWVNDGFIPWVSSGGDFVINNSTFTNNALGAFSVQTTSNLAGIIGDATGIFDNQGSFEINSNTTATNTEIEVKFNHSAAQSNFGLNLGKAGHTLTLSNNSDFTGSAYTNIVSGATLSIDNSATLALNSAGVEFDGAGLLSIESGSILDISVAPLSFNTALELNSGTINTAQNFTISSLFNWNGGTITGSGGSFTADADSTVNLNATSNLTLDTINMSTAGSTTFSSSLSDFILSNDAVWTNTGILNLANTSTAAEIETLNTTIATAQLINAVTGTINASPSANINIVAGFDNQGTVNVTSGLFEINNPALLSGTIDISSGATFLVGTGSSLTLVGTPSITGLGTLGIASGAIFDSAVALTLPQDITTQLNIGGTITNAQNLTLSGILNWNGGIITGTSGGSFTADLNSTVNLIADLSLTLDTVNMSTAGTTTFSSSLSDFILDNDAVWTNTGTLNLANTSQLADIQSANSTIATAQLINTSTGIINASPTGDNNISLFTQFDNQGTVNVTNGIFDINSPSTLSGTIDIDLDAFFIVGLGGSAGSLTLEGVAPAIIGEGIFGVDSNAILDTAVGISLPDTLTVQLDSLGTISNAQNLTLSGILNWNGGTITGIAGSSFTADATSTVNLTASDSSITLDTVNMSTTGTTTFSSALNDFILNNDAVWTNTGTVNLANTSGSANIQTDTTITTTQFINGVTGVINSAPSTNIDIFAQFDNQGVINVTSGIFEINNPSTSSGDINISSGATFLVGTGTNSSLTLSGTPSITGSGLLGVASNATLDTAVAITLPQTLTVQLNSLSLIANAQNLTLSGILNWNGGTITGIAGTNFTADATSTVNLTASDGSITLDTVNMSTVGTTTFSSASNDFILNNDAVWTNTGTLNLANTSQLADIQSANSTIASAQLINVGTINASPSDNVDILMLLDNQGSLNVTSNLLTISNLTSSGSINLASGTTLTTADLTLGGGSLIGTGTLVGNLTVDNGSLVSTGSAIGTLAVQGDVTFLAGSTLDSKIEGFNSFDQLAVIGNFASQAGSDLNLVNFNGYQGNVGDSLDVVTVTGATINSFSVINLDALYTGTIDSTAGITLNINEVNNTWSGSASTLWDLASNWSRNETPTLGHAVFIDDGFSTVDYSDAGLSVNSIELAVGNTLNLTAGDLTVINPTVLQGDLNITSAQLTMNSDLTAETINLASSATLNVAGTLTAVSLDQINSTTNVNGNVSVNSFNLESSGLVGNLTNTLSSTTGGSLADSAISGFTSVDLNDATLFVQGGLSTLANASFVHNGEINIADLASLTIPSTSLTTGASTTFKGSGDFIVGNNALLDMTSGVTFDTALSLILNGGQIINAENLTIPDTFIWRGGSISGTAGQTFTTPASSTINMTGINGDMNLVAVDMLTNGIVNYSAISNSFILNDNATWTNAGTLNMTTNAGITELDSTTASFVNSGTLNYDGTGLMNIATDFVSSGVININSGNIELPSTATLSGVTTIALGSILGFSGDAATNVDILAGSTFSGLGILGTTANLTIANGIDIPLRLIVDGGAVNFEGESSMLALDLNLGTINVDTLGVSSQGDTLTVNNLNWASGTISGDGSANLVTTGISTLEGDSLDSIASVTLDNIAWTNNGILSWTGFSTSSMTLTNASFINAASGVFNIIDVDEGVIFLGSQEIAQQGFGNKSILSDGGVFKNDGTINLINSTLDLGGETLILDTATAVLNGTGTIVGDVINTNGTVSMGSNVTAGLITIDGDYTQGADGTLIVRIVDPINGNFQFDEFAVTGLATLGGTLELEYFTNQVSSITENFNPFTFANRDGIFDTLIDSNGTILAIDISNGGFTILGTSSPTTTTSAIQEILQNQDEFEEIIDVLKEEELDETLAFIKEVIKAKKKEKKEKRIKKKLLKLVCT